ncbi:MAG: DUF1634 domain-containing protein [Trichlorobacter sp.]|uniref:DUF1634 domain-containing protein n=1 Tax=Trichlorobacter sp. TaxID=2911007 RepID=UPI002560C973|nr:DUF1634 domain-containing protein [Trichlorobacter sp.]MDK9717135.1 DUF1634 domain-containing protein [Trichlorobacter sp.]
MSTHEPDIHPASPHEPIEITLARLLRIGSFIAAVLIAAGIGTMLLGKEAAATRLITAGLLALLATPIMRVIAAGLIFIREKDWRFACFCLVVICSLAAGIYLGQTHG